MRMPGGDVSAPVGHPEAESINAKPWDSTGPTGPTRPTRPPGPPARILAVRLQAFGDTVLTLPYLQALRRMLPGTSLDFLTRSEVAELPRELVLFDHVFEIRGGRDPRRQLVSALALVPRLWARRYDAVIDLQRNRVSRVVRRLLHPRSWSEFDRFSPMLAGERTRRTIEALGFGSLHVRPDLETEGARGGAAEAAWRRVGWGERSRRAEPGRRLSGTQLATAALRGVLSLVGEAARAPCPLPSAWPAANLRARGVSARRR